MLQHARSTLDIRAADTVVSVAAITLGSNMFHECAPALHWQGSQRGGVTLQGGVTLHEYDTKSATVRVFRTITLLSATEASGKPTPPT